MAEKPVKRTESIVTKGMLAEIGIIGIYICVLMRSILL